MLESNILFLKPPCKLVIQHTYMYIQLHSLLSKNTQTYTNTYITLVTLYNCNYNKYTVIALNIKKSMSTYL